MKGLIKRLDYFECIALSCWYLIWSIQNYANKTEKSLKLTWVLSESYLMKANMAGFIWSFGAKVASALEGLIKELDYFGWLGTRWLTSHYLASLTGSGPREVRWCSLTHRGR